MAAAYAVTPACDAALQSYDHRDVCEDLEDCGWDVCWTCGAKTSAGNMNTHVAGARHQERMGMTTYCGICKVRTTSQHDMIQHLRGTRHWVSMPAVSPF